MRRVFLGAVCLCLAACGGSSPSAPSESQIAGTWVGTVTSAILQPGFVADARVTFTQSGSTIAGSYSAGAASGNLTGTVSGSSVQMTLQPSIPTACPSHVNATVSGVRMTGTYALFDCTVAESGAITMTKQ